MRDAGLIEGRRDGKSIIYQVADDRAERLVELLRDIFSGLHDVTGRRSMQRGHVAVEDIMFD